MPELTLEAIERLLSKQLENLPTRNDLENLPTKNDLDERVEELSEMIQFLTKQAAHKEDLKQLVTQAHLDGKFAEQGVSLNSIQGGLSTLRKDLNQLSKRTKEDDGAFIKDLLKLKNRMDQLERQFKKFKAVRA